MMEQHHLNGKVKLFTEAILSAAKETIPRGRRRDYIPGWNAGTSQYCQQTQREDGILPNR